MAAINQTVGYMIQRERKRCDITQEELAEIIGKSRPSLVSIEKGQVNINIDTLYNIADALNIPVTALLPDTKAQQELANIHAEFDQKLEAWNEKYNADHK